MKAFDKGRRIPIKTVPRLHKALEEYFLYGFCLYKPFDIKYIIKFISICDLSIRLRKINAEEMLRYYVLSSQCTLIFFIMPRSLIFLFRSRKHLLFFIFLHS